jgi:uncharacterized protein
MRVKASITVLSAAIIGFAMVPSVPSSSQAADPEILTISGAGPQGRWFKEASLFGKILTREMKEKTVNGVTGKGVSVGNLKRIAFKKIDAGRFYLMDMEYAHTKAAPFFSDGKDYSNAVVWMKLGTHLFRVVSGLDTKTYSDLKGKTVAIGAKNSGDDLIALRILKGYGITHDTANLKYLARSDGQNAFTNHQVDAIAFLYARNNQGHLGPIFAARPVGKSADFVKPDPDKNAAFLASDKTFFLDKFGEPAFGRPDLQGIAVSQGMAIRNDLSEDLVYRMTKTLYENWDEVLKSAPWWKGPNEASLESGPSITTVPYHAGSMRYFKEKGVWQKYH